MGGGTTIAVTTKSWWGVAGGVALGLGGIALGMVDPTPAKFYTGKFQIHYPSNLLQPGISGWLGDWGSNPALQPPPVDPKDWGTTESPTLVTIQSPNSSLSANVTDDLNGLQIVNFDWGPSGYTEQSPGPFHFFASSFISKENNLRGRLLGDFDAPPSDANFYISASEIICLPSDEVVKQNCGEPQTSYYRLERVPSPLPILGVSATLGFSRKLRKRMKSRKQP